MLPSRRLAAVNKTGYSDVIVAFFFFAEFVPSSLYFSVVGLQRMRLCVWRQRSPVSHSKGTLNADRVEVRHCSVCTLVESCPREVAIVASSGLSFLKLSNRNWSIMRSL